MRSYVGTNIKPHRQLVTVARPILQTNRDRIYISFLILPGQNHIRIRSRGQTDCADTNIIQAHSVIAGKMHSKFVV